MKNRSVEMYRIRIPVDAVKRLTAEERFAYYLLGHIYNELMCLQKLLGHALPKHEDLRPARRDPEFGQAVFLFRVAAGKLWEAKLALDGKEVSTTLRNRIFPLQSDGMNSWKALNASINAAGWLVPWRNGIGFHFPTFDKWRVHTTPDENWVDDVIFLGETKGNLFCHSSESIAMAWMFDWEGDKETFTNQQSKMIDQLITMITSMTDFLGEAIGTLVHEVILDGNGTNELVGKVSAPEHDSFQLPFWTYAKSKDHINKSY